ncbi:MAG: membrane protein insertase YidC [Elusimicrobiota bacterium]|jgi:YidC/Oxa1 family membrane protein insertase|nr:membrane protein insertase YidC [Elusimicrobiota bacterium]
MDKNFFIALGAALLFYAGYSYFFPAQKPPMPAQSAQAIARQQAAAPSSAAAAVKPVTEVPAAPQPETVYTIETKNADIVLTTKGAAVKDFIYKDIIEPVDLASYGTQGYFSTLPDINFTRVEDKTADIAFKAQIAPGLEFRKNYHFDKDGGINALEFQLVNATARDLDVSNLNLKIGPGLATVKSEQSENEANWRAVCAVSESGKKLLVVNKITDKHMSKPQKLDEDCLNWQWAGIDNRYFLAAIIPQQGWTAKAGALSFSEEFAYNKDSFFGLFGQKAVHGPKLSIALPSVVPAKSTLSYSADFYIGPKDYKYLETLPYGLDRSVQFGFFKQFGQWARGLLEWLYGITHNYGWAIVIMTLLIQTAMFPLTYKQLKSSIVMQKISPEMKRIQERYKQDPAAQQRETMALYKKYGANPFTGCLPLFIQLPIFFALFNALRTSWELHGAPFIFWISDLSAKDPYYVLPVAMGAMMFIQQKLTMPDIGKDNPSMAAMKYMPIFMTVLFLNFPAGLTLYWFVSNCISFAINIVLKKKLAKQFA